ncbi:hypothetical protein [Nocardia jiangxiensis]|uniref:Uncharacterized protein n=1 Tax=Nocardia jiangxiensis TaxID=282685 RepID=A0ABW6S514_9NOCA|nr:hypothetical protein [Nocardia jiangxiensis]
MSILHRPIGVLADGDDPVLLSTTASAWTDPGSRLPAGRCRIESEGGAR